MCHMIHITNVYDILYDIYKHIHILHEDNWNYILGMLYSIRSDTPLKQQYFFIFQKSFHSQKISMA